MHEHSTVGVFAARWALAAALVLCASTGVAAPGAGKTAAPRAGVFALSTGERIEVSGNGALVISKGAAMASLPLPRGIVELQGASEEPPPSRKVTLVLGQLCPPSRRLTLTPNDIEARFLLASSNQSLRRGRTEDALVALRQAVALAPGQPDLRLLLARTALSTGQAQEAERVLQDGISVTPFDVHWEVRQDPRLAPFAAKLAAAATRSEPLSLTENGQPSGAAWSSSRRLLAWIDEAWRLRVSAPGGAEVFTAELALGRELDQQGEVLASARRAVEQRAALAGEMLSRLGFRAIPPRQYVATERGGGLSWARWPERGLTASAGQTVIRVRNAGRLVFERRIDTMGTIALDWGASLPSENLLLLGWSRASGNDACPNPSGVEIVDLPPGS